MRLKRLTSSSFQRVGRGFVANYLLAKLHQKKKKSDRKKMLKLVRSVVHNAMTKSKKGGYYDVEIEL